MSAPRRTGIANLPLHYGKAPRWLFDRMVPLAREITIAIVTDFGPEEMLRRLSHPYWFQAFGCILGFDWHSSGVTTTLCGALKEALKGIERDLGLFVAGGKGKTSRRTPSEIESWGERIALNPAPLVYASRMSAKVDSSAVQDGYTTSFPLDYIMNNDILMAYKMNDVTLPPERGFPFQLVAESKWGYKWAKWITEIELSDDVDYEGYWESRGYSNEGDLDKGFFD